MNVDKNLLRPLPVDFSLVNNDIVFP